MSYIKSLRFKLMLLCVIPLVSLAVIFIAHSVVIAYQVKNEAVTAYVDTLIQAGADETMIQAEKDVSLDMGWIARQWIVFFLVCFVVFYIPITINIRKFIMPIRKASSYSDSLARGDLQIDVIKNRTDEIGVLQASLQNLVHSSRQQAELIQRIADGDISGSYSPRSDADAVGHSLVQMLERNNNAISQISMAASQLLMATSQIAGSSQGLASGATQQAAAVEELLSSVSEVSQAAHNNVELANKAADLGTAIMNSAEKGSRQMEQMVAAVKAIKDASHDIEKVIKVIDDIAFQTNILALNASVEAARAGQHGKGFAVVAEEVRNLANKSAEAAMNSGSLIADSMKKAELGTRIADETALNLSKIVAGINESSLIISDIAHSNRTLDKAIDQINRGMDQVSQVVQQNSATAEETAASSEEMNSQSEILQSMVSQFKLKESLNAGNQNLSLSSRRQSSHNDTSRFAQIDSEYGKY